MKKDIKAKWVKALRSGKYKKTQGGLKDTKGYCCLGVLTNLYIKETKKGKWVKEGLHYSFVGKNEEGEEALLPRAVQRWAGFQTSSPHLKKSVEVEGSYGKTFQDSLVGINDDTKKNFKFIADAIEKQL